MTTWDRIKHVITTSPHYATLAECGVVVTINGETRRFWDAGWLPDTSTLVLARAVIFNVDSHAASFDAGAGWGEAA